MAVVDQVTRFKVALVATYNYDHKTIRFALSVWELSTLFHVTNPSVVVILYPQCLPPEAPALPAEQADELCYCATKGGRFDGLLLSSPA